MAAVQPQNMPQQGAGGNAAAQPNVLPPGMSKEQVAQLYKRYQQMKASGVPENDPEMIKARNILQGIQQKTEMFKRQAAYRQAQLKQQQLAMQNGQLMANGQQPGIQTAAQGSIEASTNGAQASPITDAGQERQQPQSTDETQRDSSMSSEQIDLLRAQMKAFSSLSKNKPIPKDIRNLIFATKQEPAESEADAIANASKALDEVARPAGADGVVDEQSRHKFTSYKDPHSMIEPKTISFAMHARRNNRPSVPSFMPLGYDLEYYRHQREQILYNRIESRKKELGQLSANIGAWDTSKSDTPTDNANVKLKALIEYKALNLLQKQRNLRQSIGREMQQSDMLAMSANRTNYRRVKRQSLREARITEKLEKQQRDAAENKEKKKHSDFVQSIVGHAGDIRKSGIEQRERARRLGRVMVNTHANIEKEEQKRIERTAKQRLLALRNNDEATYLKLLDQAKDSRISHLLKQTDGFLGQLASSVKEQQRSMSRRFGVEQEISEDEEEEVDSDDETKPKIDYYEVAHRIKEEVKTQATSLVGGTLKEYQLKGLQWMISLYNNNLNGILADEMGLGKTIQSISLITYLIEKKRQPGPYLVIVPLSTLTNWNNEFEKWAPSVARIVYKGPPNQRKTQAQQIRYGNFQVLLTTYEYIIRDRPVLSKIKWLHMIVDEGHRMKNAGSKLSSTITQYYHTRYRLILTGTPLQNNLPELWALLNFVLPNIFKSVKSFDEWFNTPFANTGGSDKMELTEEEQLLVIKRLHKVLRPFLLRRLKKDVEKDLPDKQERVIKCNFSALQAKLYKQLATHNKIMVNDEKSGKRTGMRGLSNMLMQLRKLCNHPFVFEEVEDQMNPERLTNDLIWRTAGKFELLDRVLPKFQATGHRVLMFFQMTQIMNIMEDFLRYRGVQYLRLDGSTKADDRSELLKLFNAPNSPYFCFLLSTRAGGLGLNLQTADTVIIYDSDWNPHQDLQAQDRAHRIGQKNEVRILRLISSNSVEEKILERAQFKLDMDGKVIQAGKFDNKSTNEERDEMLRVMLETAEAADSLEQDEMDDDDLNLMMMRSEDELALFQKMDAERLKNQAYGPDKKYPRLLGESELPDIYLNEENPVVEEIEFNYGRGARERTKVKYDDGLTEEQWADAVDADDDTIEDAIARKQARIAKRSAKKDNRAQEETELGDSPPASRDSSESPQPQPKKRGRKPGKAVEKRKADEASLDGIEPPKKRGRTKVQETLSDSDRRTLQAILDNVYEALQDLEETQPGMDARGIIDPFVELPPRSLYPDYYELITRPICMKQIETKINKKEYQSLREFLQDIKLLCNNCRTYNEDGSMLYNDANLIEQAAIERTREQAADHPELQGPDDTSSKFDAASRPMSSTGTPQPARSGIKLKLNGSRPNGSQSRQGTDSLAQSDEE